MCDEKQSSEGSRWKEGRKGAVMNGIKLSEVTDGFGWAVSMRQVAHFMTWASEEMEVFRSPFFRSRFASSRPVGKSILERVMNFFVDKAVLFPYDQAIRLGWH